MNSVEEANLKIKNKLIQSNLQLPRAGYSGMGDHYVLMDKLQEKRDPHPIRKRCPQHYQSGGDIDLVLKTVRDKAFEMDRHDKTLTLAHLQNGKERSRQETVILEKHDRSTLASNFQDLGIKTRTGIKAPVY